jgi:hydroxyacylglutathione hydrolase
MMFEVIPIPAFRDNYIWLLHCDGHAVVVDPGDAQPVLAVLYAKQLDLDAILITHHHADHTGGVAELLKTFPAKTYAPRKEDYSFPHQAVSEGEHIKLEGLDLDLTVLETPGHTLGHVVYFGANSLFCGDTLFSCGCGRLFEGSCQQLYQSLQRLAALPPETLVYCTHEYTRHNIRFARTLDPENIDLERRAMDVEQLLARGQPSLPTTIGSELATNPFLRCHVATIRNAAMMQAGITDTDPESVFCAVRQLRNTF